MTPGEERLFKAIEECRVARERRLHALADRKRTLTASLQTVALDAVSLGRTVAR